MKNSKELIYVDTGAFFALKNSRDEYHEKAIKIKDQLLFKGSLVQLITIKPILYETLNLAKKKLGTKQSIELGEMFYQTRFIDIYEINEKTEKAGWEIFKKYQDQRYSFTDCISFAFMEALKIKRVFAFDNHFTQFRFELIK